MHCGDVAWRLLALRTATDKKVRLRTTFLRPEPKKMCQAHSHSEASSVPKAVRAGCAGSAHHSAPRPVSISPPARRTRGYDASVVSSQPVTGVACGRGGNKSREHRGEDNATPYHAGYLRRGCCRARWPSAHRIASHPPRRSSQVPFGTDVTSFSLPPSAQTLPPRAAIVEVHDRRLRIGPPTHRSATSSAHYDPTIPRCCRLSLLRNSVAVPVPRSLPVHPLAQHRLPRAARSCRDLVKSRNDLPITRTQLLVAT